MHGLISDNVFFTPTLSPLPHLYAGGQLNGRSTAG
jgi:hypothetical protein